MLMHAAVSACNYGLLQTQMYNHLCNNAVRGLVILVP